MAGDYIDRKELRAEIIACQSSGIVSERLGVIFLILADNILRAFNFTGFDLEDARGEVVCLYCRVYKLVKTGKKDNPFSFLTTCALNQIKQKYRTAKNFNDFLSRFYEELQIEFDQENS